MPYWFGSRALPDGSSTVSGPFPDVDTTNRERRKAKRGDVDVSTWFVADDEAHALKKAQWQLEGAPFPSDDIGAD